MLAGVALDTSGRQREEGRPPDESGENRKRQQPQPQNPKLVFSPPDKRGTQAEFATKSESSKNWWQGGTNAQMQKKSAELKAKRQQQAVEDKVKPVALDIMSGPKAPLT